MTSADGLAKDLHTGNYTIVEMVLADDHDRGQTQDREFTQRFMDAVEIDAIGASEPGWLTHFQDEWEERKKEIDK